jgi:hypothetical protein
MIGAMWQRPSRLALVGLCAALFLPACSEDMFDAESDLVVLNDSMCEVVVYVDGREGFTVKPGSDRTLDDIGNGRHVFEALDARGGVIERRSVDLAGGEDFYWILDDC